MNILCLTYCFHSTGIILAEVQNILFRDRAVPAEAADMASKLILCGDIERQRNVDDERNLLSSSNNGGLSRAGSSGVASDVDDIVPELQDRESNSKNMNNNNNNYHKYAFEDSEKEKEKEKRNLKIRRIKSTLIHQIHDQKFCYTIKRS